MSLNILKTTFCSKTKKNLDANFIGNDYKKKPYEAFLDFMHLGELSLPVLRWKGSG